MTIDFLSIISIEPSFVPDIYAREAALAAFGKMLPMAESVDIFEYNEIRFVDPGMRFKYVGCPLCKCKLDQIWWGDAMSAAERENFRNLAVTLPCCDAPSALNDLVYHMSAGFARFLLRARLPKPGRYFAVDDLQTLESILGTRLQPIWTRLKKSGDTHVVD